MSKFIEYVAFCAAFLALASGAVILVVAAIMMVLGMYE